MPYELEPRYPIVDGKLEIGYRALAADAAGVVPGVLAVDGPAALDWTSFIRSLVAAIGHHNIRVQQTDARTRLRDWSDIQQRTETPTLRDDPVFAKPPSSTLVDLFAALPAAGPREEVTDQRAMEPLRIVFGPGAALAPHDALWYADLPKRVALRRRGWQRGESRQPLGKRHRARLMFVDWAARGRARRTLVSRSTGTSTSGRGTPRSYRRRLRRSLTALVGGPFRTRPRSSRSRGAGAGRRGLGARESSPTRGRLRAHRAGERRAVGERGPHRVGLDLLLAEHARPDRC